MFSILLMFRYILFSFFACATLASALRQSNRFPRDFLFGASSSAYQIEGGWNADGKGPSIWDEFVHLHPEKIADRQNADVGANSYKFYRDDIAAVKSMNMDFYRFSISWPRILPTGDIANVNEKGIDYYNKLIDKLLEQNIEPMITIFHYDLPLQLQRIGGWANSIIVDYFKAYANLLFERFGDRVKFWVTFNEPSAFCKSLDVQFGLDGGKLSGIADYLCGHNALKAHAVAYHLYKKSYFERFHGQIGIALDSYFYYSATNDSLAVDRAMQFFLGWFAHPIFSSQGNYPEVMISQIANNSRQEGRAWSRLPTFSKRWIDRIRGSADFLGFNYYTSRFVETPDKPIGNSPSFYRDRNIRDIIDPKWKPSITNWVFSVPKGFGDILRWIKNEYNNPNVYVTENGWPDSGELDDIGRIEYYHDHLEQIQNVISIDKCNVKGFTAWAIIDNFEWGSGYTVKFGLYAINMTSPRKERIAKKSVEFMKELITTRQIPDIK